MLMGTKKNANKRPRGLDVLLGHLLGKEYSQGIKLSSTKNAENLSQK